MPESNESRWLEVTHSPFPHESAGLDLVRQILPNEAPFRAWSNLTFMDQRGRWHEVDLLVLGRGALHLIELKYYEGVLRGNEHTWRRDGKRPEESPLRLANDKAKFLKSRLAHEIHELTRKSGENADPREVVPFVKASVFLHHPRFHCAVTDLGKNGLYGPDDIEAQTGLPGISHLVLEEPHHDAVNARQERILSALITRISHVQRRERTFGAWELAGAAADSGDGWQDWDGTHTTTQERVRIRFQTPPPGSAPDTRKAMLSMAVNELKTLGRLHHDGLVPVRDVVDCELGIGLAYPYDESWERLDLWLSAQPQGVPLATHLSILRQVGETLQYAHSNRVVHRSLSPRAVWVRPVSGTSGEVKVRIGDWRVAGAVDPTATTTSNGVTRLAALGGAVPTPQGPPPPAGLAATVRSEVADVLSDRWLTEGFAAPESFFNPDVDRIRLDVFGLGAIAFYLLAGVPAARTTQALRTRLREQEGLDVAIELPQVSSALRALMQRATHPMPTQRPVDMASFLELLAAAEREATADDAADVDPLDAGPGSVIDGRFRLERRLGQGSTAVGLLVTDLTVDGNDSQRVLKVALDDESARRLGDEADVLRGLSSPRIVKLVDGPIVVGGRQALLLESAGPQTLTEALRGRTRLSLDLLERFGSDLLQALVTLDKAGVDHRDIKPSNLGVREGRGDRTKHLVLFDFSLTRAAASATSAGTPPYLDPFLVDDRDHYDSAAERYAAAVVLFEMATGATPLYGDGQADPASITADASVESELFDPILAPRLMDFFTRALARDASQRHDTASAMQREWQAIFATDATTEPDESNDDLAARAALDTPLAESGLTARALSALEPYAVATVGELLTVDSVRLSRLQGVANATRLQISRRVKEWRKRLGDPRRVPARDERTPTPTDAAERLLAAVSTSRSPSRGALVRLILGVGTDLDAFATQPQLGARLPEPVTRARVGQILATLQEKWAADDACRSLLDHLVEAVDARLDELGHVAAVRELTTAVADCLSSEVSPDERRLRGLLRLALERRQAVHRANDTGESLWLRRRDDLVLVATEQALLDVAETLGAEADDLVAALGDWTSEVVPAPTVTSRLQRALPAESLPANMRDGARLARLAAATSRTAAASGAGELHHRDFSRRAALAVTFSGFGGGQQLSPEELRQRVRIRFPSVPVLPEGEALSRLVTDAGLGLVFDDQTRVYRAPTTAGRTTGLETREPTRHAVRTSPVSDGAIGSRLERSISSRAFLALGVRADRVSRFVDGAQRQFDAEVIDLTEVLLDALRAASADAGLPWDLVRAADADGVGSRGQQGLHELVRRSWPKVALAVDTALAAPGRGPVLVTEASPLARYDNLGLLAQWTDLGATRPRAVWLALPQLAANHGPLVDGRPVPLAAPSQYVALDNDWVDAIATPVAAHAVHTGEETHGS
ncbi:BREX system serine/threonine kinase PglW [Phycicoccus flavus]|uniref:non-specific serine/threonine protein kinase n=1 Tax=Phycicoccus flavus TaxID=2502783 RepID=A0A8T6QYD7_9MICO|nr:BREX system serine/threonine kinase PglW [Phycicoccus flavus]NHA66848.1 BREX system serine/threonine kinase PglW [Phycicoccus flavus]